MRSDRESLNKVVGRKKASRNESSRKKNSDKTKGKRKLMDFDEKMEVCKSRSKKLTKENNIYNRPTTKQNLEGKKTFNVETKYRPIVKEKTKTIMQNVRRRK